MYFLNLFILFLHTCYIYVCFQLAAFIREHMWHKAFLMGYFVYIFIYIYMCKDGCCRSKERMRIYFKIRMSTKRFVFFRFIYFVLTYVLYICMSPACCFHQRTYVAQGLFNGVLNETWTHSCFQYVRTK